MPHRDGGHGIGTGIAANGDRIVAERICVSAKG